jgi:hypothetical protein
MATPAQTDLETPCPACGYDLRGSSSDLCPECGLHIDRESLRTSAIPWAHRKQIGRLKAYFKTAWQITVGARALKYEAVKEQNPRDGVKFSRITAAILAPTFIGAYAAITVAGGGFHVWAYTWLDRLPDPLPVWPDNMGVPWSAGAILPPVLPVALLLFAFYVTGSPRGVFRVRGSAAARQRAYAIASYLTAPLIFLPIAVICLGAAPWLERRVGEVFTHSIGWRVALVVIGCGAVVGFFSIGTTLVRIAHWHARVRHTGVLAAILGLGEVLLVWLFGGVVLLVVFPWLVGLILIAIDGFL